MSDSLHVVFSANRSYLPYLLTALTSLRHFLCPDCRLRVIILSRELTRDEIAWRNQAHHDELHCFAPEIPKDGVLPIRQGDHLTVEAYYRLFLESAISSNIDRVIYLDADLVVLADLSPLRTIDLQGRTVGAVRDFGVTKWSECSPPLPSDGTMGQRPYLNSGVLVIDVERWKRNAVRQRALEFLRDHEGEIRYWDQDALNFVLAEDWLELDPRWNRTSNYWTCLREGLLPFDNESTRSLNQPFIVHFANPVKPWMSYRHPDRPWFDRFAQLAGVGHVRMTFWKSLCRGARARLTARIPALFRPKQGTV